jgi:hypothetical protein
METPTLEQAVALAKKHGLSLTDAVQMVRLASSDAELDTAAAAYTKNTKTPQLTRAQVQGMTSAQIVKAKEEGRLADLLAGGGSE